MSCRKSGCRFTRQPGLHEHYQENTYYTAVLSWQDLRVRNVAVRSRGTGSRNPVKIGLRVDFDRYTTGQNFLGLRSLILDNNWQDPSLLTERTAMAFFERLGEPAPRESYCRLFVNNVFQGLCSIVESVDTPFLARIYGDDQGLLFRFADLARTRGLRVISRTSSMYYKGQKKSMPDIAAELGVDLLVEGSVARSGNRVRVTAQLIDGPRDEHIWARTYDHTVDDVLALQSQIATAIAGEVRGRGSRRERAVGFAAGSRSGALRTVLARRSAAEVIAFLTEPTASSPDDLVTLAIAVSRTGDPARARAIVTDLSLRQPVPAGPLARWYAASGDTDRALTLLEQVAKETPRLLPQIANDPSFDRVRSSARFKRLTATPTAG